MNIGRIGTVIVLLCAVALTACFHQPTEAERIAKARDYLAAGKSSSAVIELKNALEQNANSGEARFLLGRIYADDWDYESAAKELQRADELGYDANQVMPVLARTWFAQGEYARVTEAASAVAGYSAEAAADLLTSSGLAYLARGDADSAAELLDQAAQYDEKLPYLGEARARLAAVRGDFTAARQLLARLTADNPRYAAAWILLAQIEQRHADLEAAEVAYGHAIEAAPNNADVLFNRALLRIELGKLDDAEQDLNALAKLDPRSLAVTYGRGLVMLHREDFKGAQEAFETVAGTTDDFLPALYYSGLTSFALGHEEQAEKSLNRFLARVRGNGPANRMLAAISLKRGDLGRAEQMARRAVKAQPDDVQSLGVLAEVLLRGQKVDEAVTTLRRMQELEPKSASIRVALANAYMRQGHPDAALDALQTAMSLDPGSEAAAIGMARMRLGAADREQALAGAEQFLAANPDSAMANNLVAAIHMAQGDVQKATSAFDRARELSPGDRTANSGLALMAIVDQRFDDARAFYNNVLKQHPSDLDTLLNLATLESMQRNTDAAVDALTRAAEGNPDALKPRLLLVQHYVAEKEPAKALALFEGRKTAELSDTVVLGLLGNAAAMLDRFDEADSYVKRLLELSPDDAQVHYFAARTRLSLKDYRGARTGLEEALRLRPDLVAARMDLAELLLRTGETDAAAQEIARLGDAPSATDRMATLKGRLAEQQGDVPAAIAAYTRAFELTPNNINLLQLTNVQWAAGRHDDVLTALRGWLQEHPDDNLTRLELGNRLLALEQTDAAIDAFRKVLDAQPENVIALNNMAWLLREHDHARALKYAEQASALAPDALNVTDTHAMVLLAGKDRAQHQRARRLMDRILEANPRNRVALYHSAEIDSVLGNRSTAVETLTALLQDPAPFAEREAAERLLEKLQN